MICNIGEAAGAASIVTMQRKLNHMKRWQKVLKEGT
jgi:hypothetical protein